MRSIFYILMFTFAILNSESYGQEKSAKVSSTVVDILCPPAPAWVDKAVFYEIYPQTFYDSNGDGIGDLQGIIEKLDYVKSLGVNAIWLNPFYESPFRDAGYDVSDYYKVAPRYGTNGDAKRLFTEVHKRGMHIIIDYVPGHTSIDHPWFKESAKAGKNKYSNWYIWTDRTWDDHDRCKFTFIQGYCERDGNYLPNFFWHQPALNYGFAKPDPAQPWQLSVNHPDVLALKAEMQKVMRFWLDMGCDGFRIDMAGSLIKEDVSGECSKYWQTVRKMLNTEYPDAFIVSEWSDPKAAIAGGFHADFFHWFNGFNDLFTFFNSDGKGNIAHFMDIYLNQLDSVKRYGYISLPLANHDLPRLRQPGGRSLQDVEVIFAFELTMPGIPFLYYGDEIGMVQLPNLPATEGSYGSRAGARTPMQWNNNINKGFSKTNPNMLYRSVDTSETAPTVADAEKYPESLLQHLKMLINIRNTEPALTAYTDFIPLYCQKNKYPFIYIRKWNTESILVALNPSSEETSTLINIDNLKPMLIAGNGAITILNEQATIYLKGRSYALFKMNQK